MEEENIVLPATERQPLPPPTMGTVQEVGFHRGLRADDGMSWGLGMGTMYRSEVGGSTVALNLQAERLRAVGYD